MDLYCLQMTQKNFFQLLSVTFLSKRALGYGFRFGEIYVKLIALYLKTILVSTLTIIKTSISMCIIYQRAELYFYVVHMHTSLLPTTNSYTYYECVCVNISIDTKSRLICNKKLLLSQLYRVPA